MDAMGKIYGGNSDNELESKPSSQNFHTHNLAYLKLVNVPSMFDIGLADADPQSDSLSL